MLLSLPQELIAHIVGLVLPAHVATLTSPNYYKRKKRSRSFVSLEDGQPQPAIRQTCKDLRRISDPLFFRKIVVWITRVSSAKEEATQKELLLSDFVLSQPAIACLVRYAILFSGSGALFLYFQFDTFPGT